MHPTASFELQLGICCQVKGSDRHPECPFACRIDCFSEMASDAFGQKMKAQVEERLRFYDEGIAPMKNITAMQVSCICDAT